MATKAKFNPKTKFDKLANELAEKAIKLLYQGKIPWSSGRKTVQPQNDKRVEYSGVNWLNGIIYNIETGNSPVMLTFKAAQANGLSVKGQKSPFSIFFFNMVFKYRGKAVDYGFYKEKEATDPEGCTSYPALKAYPVFSLSQCEGDKSKWEGVAPEPPKSAEEINSFIAATGAKFRREYGVTPHCAEDGSEIVMPASGEYSCSERETKTKFHELIHWTGAAGRISKNGRKSFLAYTKNRPEEELTAEIGAAMLCAHFGLDSVTENSDAYCQHWAGHIKDKPEIVYRAAKEASKAVSWLLK
jgi:antirestriction protein ArdC